MPPPFRSLRLRVSARRASTLPLQRRRQPEEQPQLFQPEPPAAVEHRPQLDRQRESPRSDRVERVLRKQAAAGRSWDRLSAIPRTVARGQPEVSRSARSVRTPATSQWLPPRAQERHRAESSPPGRPARESKDRQPACQTAAVVQAAREPSSHPLEPARLASSPAARPGSRGEVLARPLSSIQDRDSPLASPAQRVSLDVPRESLFPQEQPQPSGPGIWSSPVLRRLHKSAADPPERFPGHAQHPFLAEQPGFPD